MDLDEFGVAAGCAPRLVPRDHPDDAVTHALARRQRLDAQILALAEDSQWTPATRRQHSRAGLRYQGGLTDAEWAVAPRRSYLEVLCWIKVDIHFARH